MKTNKTGIIYIALIAALVASFCDKIHVITNTLYYPKPVIDGQPWWTYPGFFVAFIAMTFVYMQLVHFLPKNISRSYSTSKVDAEKMISSLLFFAFAYMISGFGNDYPTILNILLYGTFFIRIMFATDKTFLLILGIIISISGVLGEFALSSFDLVYYTKPVFLLVPAWLGAVYLHGAIALRDFMRFFVYRSN